MMYSKGKKNTWSWFMVILAGLVIGGFIGHYLNEMPYINWLALGQKFKIDPPVSLDLGIIRLQLGMMLEFNIGGFFGAIIAVFLYRNA